MDIISEYWYKSPLTDCQNFKDFFHCFHTFSHIPSVIVRCQSVQSWKLSFFLNNGVFMDANFFGLYAKHMKNGDSLDAVTPDIFQFV